MALRQDCYPNAAGFAGKIDVVEVDVYRYARAKFKLPQTKQI